MSDVRALGSIFSQSAFLPYVSGLAVPPLTDVVCPNGRAVYINASADGQQLVVRLADQPSQLVTLSGFVVANTPELLPIAVTAIDKASTASCVVFF